MGADCSPNTCSPPRTRPARASLTVRGLLSTWDWRRHSPHWNTASIQEEPLKQSCISTYVQISAWCSLPHRQQRQYRNNFPFQRCRGHPHHPRTDRPTPSRVLTAPPSGRKGLCARLLSSEQAPSKEAQTVKWESSPCFFLCQCTCILPENGTHLLRNNVPLPQMNVDGVQRGRQKKVLTPAVERPTLENRWLHSWFLQSASDMDFVLFQYILGWIWFKGTVKPCRNLLNNTLDSHSADCTKCRGAGKQPLLQPPSLRLG